MVKKVREKMKASDYVFCVDTSHEEDGVAFCITSAAYFEENGCLCDGQEDADIDEVLPPKFANLMEGSWEYYGESWQEGKQKLLDAGFVYSDELDDFINGYEERLKAFQEAHAAGKTVSYDDEVEDE